MTADRRWTTQTGRGRNRRGPRGLGPLGRLAAAASLAVSLLGAGRAAALQCEGEKVTAVAVMGNRTVSDTLIFNKLETREEGLFSEETVRADVTRLYELGYFANISVDVERAEGGVKVAYVVKEKPELREIGFKGNAALSTERLRREMKSKPGEALNERLLVEDQDALSKLYAAEGFPAAEVRYEIVTHTERPEAIAVFTVREGERQAISRIVFSGNDHVPAKRLVTLMQTKRRAPWPLFKWPLSYLYSTGLLDEDAFSDDLERIRAYYASLGYVDMKYGAVEKKLSPDGRFIDIEIAVEEGGTYQVGEVTISGNKIYDTDELRRALTMGPDSVFSPNALQADINAVRALYFAKGHTDAEIASEKRLNPETGRIDIAYAVKEYDPYYVGRIDIRGNTRTKDHVIRREIGVMPGDVFNALKIQRSRERLENTGYFDSVKVASSPGEEGRTQNLSVDLEEGKTGQLSFGAGFSSIDGFIGFARDRPEQLRRVESPVLHRRRAEAQGAGGARIRAAGLPLQFHRAVLHGAETRRGLRPALPQQPVPERLLQRGPPRRRSASARRSRSSTAGGRRPQDGERPHGRRRRRLGRDAGRGRRQPHQLRQLRALPRHPRLDRLPAPRRRLERDGGVRGPRRRRGVRQDRGDGKPVFRPDRKLPRPWSRSPDGGPRAGVRRLLGYPDVGAVLPRRRRRHPRFRSTATWARATPTTSRSGARR